MSLVEALCGRHNGTRYNEGSERRRDGRRNVDILSRDALGFIVCVMNVLWWIACHLHSPLSESRAKLHQA